MHAKKGKAKQKPKQAGQTRVLRGRKRRLIRMKSTEGNLFRLALENTRMWVLFLTFSLTLKRLMFRKN